MRGLCTILLFLASIQLTQAQNDFRGLSWGMSIEEIKKIETAPLTKEEKNFVGRKDGKAYYDGISLIYQNVTVGGRNADIYYELKNGKLLKIRVVYRPALYGFDGKMSDIISRFTTLYEGLVRRGFKYSDPLQCGEHAYFGADYRNQDNEKIRQMTDWRIDKAKLELVDKMVSEKKYKSVFFRIENERSRGLVNFYTEYSDMMDIAPVVFELTPSFEIENKINTLDF